MLKSCQWHLCCPGCWRWHYCSQPSCCCAGPHMSAAGPAAVASCLLVAFRACLLSLVLLQPGPATDCPCPPPGALLPLLPKCHPCCLLLVRSCCQRAGCTMLSPHSAVTAVGWLCRKPWLAGVSRKTARYCSLWLTAQPPYCCDKLVPKCCSTTAFPSHTPRQTTSTAGPVCCFQLAALPHCCIPAGACGVGVTCVTHLLQCLSTWAGACTGVSVLPQSQGAHWGQSVPSDRGYRNRMCLPACGNSDTGHRRVVRICTPSNGQHSLLRRA
jgi:hypothetical protein